MCWLSVSVGVCLPIAAAGVLESCFPAADGVVDFTLAKDFLAVDPSADGPAGERDAVPRGPAGFGRLLGVVDGRGLVEIDEDEIGVVADGNAALVDDVPDAGGGVAHPVDDLLDRAAAAVDFVQHQ